MSPRAADVWVLDAEKLSVAGNLEQLVVQRLVMVARLWQRSLVCPCSRIWTLALCASPVAVVIEVVKAEPEKASRCSVSAHFRIAESASSSAFVSLSATLLRGARVSRRECRLRCALVWRHSAGLEARHALAQYWIGLYAASRTIQV